MHLHKYCLRNFRRLENVEINLGKIETVFVGANNSGKTSAASAFRLFVLRKSDFKIHDFSAPLIAKLDKFGKVGIQSDRKIEEQLPFIEMDLWFSVSPETEYGRISQLLPSFDDGVTEIGVRICFAVNDPEALLKAYRSTLSTSEVIVESEHKTLSYFLAKGENLKRHFGLKYFRLEKTSFTEPHNSLCLHLMEKEQGQSALSSLLHIEYIDAQRNINDNDSAQSNRLSAVLADFYKQNLKKQEHDTESVRVIDKSNDGLSEHYAKQFAPLIDIISSVGFPALYERELRIISDLKAEKALSGNTTVTYVEAETEHQLPEAYNGLGFKNLIYMAIQMAHFQIRWAETEKNRPLCLIVFVEEPEAHLHAQVQQTFIRQIKKIVEKTKGDSEKYTHQLVVTTHSSHIMDEVDFQSIRYFRRVNTSYPLDAVKREITATEVLNLANFDGKSGCKDNLEFLQKYLKLTHCDLFFADAAILVEGTVERLLLPLMIKKEAAELSSAYITTLELGGAYAHRFLALLEFINLPTLIITDLDSVDPQPKPGMPKSKNSACRADLSRAVTSNACLKSLTGIGDISTLIGLTADKKVSNLGNHHRYITFQRAVSVPAYGENLGMTPRTFEESFIYENLDGIRQKKIQAFISLPHQLHYEDDYQNIYDSVCSNDYKKVEFALQQIDSKEEWATPAYIAEGLKWLRKTLGLEPSHKVNATALSVATK